MAVMANFRPLGLITFLVILISQVATAARLELRILPSTLIPNPNTLPASTHATLTSESGEVLRAVLRNDNSIVFEDIDTLGSHLLDIFTRDFTFAPYRIDTVANQSPSDTESGAQIKSATETYRGTLWSDRGVSIHSITASPVSKLSMVPRVEGQKAFYEPRPGFNPLSLLKNPMILMGGVALLFTFGMPKLLENMDPEMRAEYEEIQKKGPMTSLMGGGGGAAGSSSTAQKKSPAMDFDLAGYLAGSGGSKKQAESSGRDTGVSDIRDRKK